MTFGEKLRKLRTDNGLTQEQLAEKIFITRTAISKWESGNGYPSIDSLKQLSKLFDISIDKLISDEDVENKKILDEKNARRAYYIAVSFLALAVIFTLIAYFLKQPYLNIISSICSVMYLVFAVLAKPEYKRMQVKKMILPYIVSRIIIFAVVVGVAVFTILSL